MNKIRRSLLLFIMFCILVISILPVTALANSAEPPSLIILVNNPPEDLSIVLISNENQPEATFRRVAWEGYYVFYSRHMHSNGEYTFKVTTNGESFECTLGGVLKYYNNVATLDLPSHQLKMGKYPFRSVLLVSIRLLLTLLIEGIIFWLFKFREKRSWLIFLVVNLITQGSLNIWLNSGSYLMQSYLILNLIAGEIYVFAAEMIVFPVLIKEHGKGRILTYAFISNLISLILGGYIISVLPV